MPYFIWRLCLKKLFLSFFIYSFIYGAPLLVDGDTSKLDTSLRPKRRNMNHLPDVRYPNIGENGKKSNMSIGPLSKELLNRLSTDLKVRIYEKIEEMRFNDDDIAYVEVTEYERDGDIIIAVFFQDGTYHDEFLKNHE
jgi:hypothetical protein